MFISSASDLRYSTSLNCIKNPNSILLVLSSRLVHEGEGSPKSTNQQRGREAQTSRNSNASSNAWIVTLDTVQHCHFLHCLWQPDKRRLQSHRSAAVFQLNVRSHTRFDKSFTTRSESNSPALLSDRNFSSLSRIPLDRSMKRVSTSTPQGQDEVQRNISSMTSSDTVKW